MDTTHALHGHFFCLFARFGALFLGFRDGQYRQRLHHGHFEVNLIVATGGGRDRFIRRVLVFVALPSLENREPFVWTACEHFCREGDPLGEPKRSPTSVRLII